MTDQSIPVITLDNASIPAFQTLLFLNLHTNQYQAALDLLEHPPSSLSLDFEKAYCLYRLHREKEALVILQGLTHTGRKEQHLEAQIVSTCKALVIVRNGDISRTAYV